MGVVSSLNGLILTRIGIGIFEAPCFPANSRVLATWFPQHERARANRDLFGRAVCRPRVPERAAVLDHAAFGWRGLFFIVGGSASCSRSVWWALYRNPSGQHRPSNQAELDYIEAGGGGEYKGQPVTFKWRHIAALLRHRQVLGASIGQFGGNSTQVFFVTWFPTYLVTARGMTFIKAGLMTSLPLHRRRRSACSSAGSSRTRS